MKNIDYSLFFKANFIVTLILFGLFLQYNDSYSFLSATFSLMGVISSVAILYILFYIVLFLFSFSFKLVLYMASFLFVIVDIAILIDFFIYRLYKFHINAMVVNILTSPDAADSIQLGVMPIVFSILIVLFFIIFEIVLIRKLASLDKDNKISFNSKINKMVFIPLFLIILSEKVGYGMFSLFSKNEIVSKFKVIPLYQPLTFSKLAYKYFGFKPAKEAKNIIQTKASLNYPRSEIEFKAGVKKINIFIVAFDATRYTILDENITPNINVFKKDAISFEHHYSGGNATRFGIFSLMYGLNSTYWFSFLQANRGSVLFDVLKKLDYQISIISSTNTNWPEFRKTCYVDVQDSISDDFDGLPWEKDIQSTKKFLEKIDNFDKDKPIFSFIFLDAPHGYSFPPDENIFKAEEDINYLTVSKDGKDIKSFFAGYKNAVHFNDRLFADMVKKLKEKNLYDDSLIIFTSDHGQEFYEYGYFGHNSAFDEAQLHVPFIIKFPKQMQNSVTLPANFPNILTSHNDVVPSVLKILGVKNNSSDFSNGFDMFSKDFKREYLFSANWNNNAVITEKKTYLFSNLPNKMFKNEVKNSENYKKIEGKINSKILLQVMDENRMFLK